MGLPWGTCRWCAELILRDDGTPNWRRRWHPDCLTEYQRLHWPEVQASYVNDRDHGVCADCQEQCGGWINYGTVDLWKGSTAWIPAWGPYSSVDFIITGIEVDHIVPLWLSAGLPAEERLPFFLMTNLQSLCGSCHKAKSAVEARERAEFRKC